MDFKIEIAHPNDAARLTDIYFAAFTNELSRRIMPHTDDVRDFQIAGFKKDAEQSRSASSKRHLVKIVGKAPDKTPVITGFARWRLFEGDADEGVKSGVQWPASSDAALCNSFFTKVDAERRRAVGDQQHYYLELLAVDPAFGRRGLGARLLKWGLNRADEARVITFISSSPSGRGLYEKHGCRALNNYQVIPGYRETSMIRPVGGMSRG